MKILLTAVNAKYIHSNLAVYSLKSYAQSYMDDNGKDVQIEIAEYTINQLIDDILRDIYLKAPDVLCLSCYIWNIQYIEEIVREYSKICPETMIWLGGPEVSYDAVKVLERLPMVKGVVKGEGEETFKKLAEGEDLDQIQGITYRTEEGKIVEQGWRPVMNLSNVPFVYHDMEDFKNKIIYYESSRGCPFNCSYCLSSIDKKLRFRDLDLVKKELQFFIDQEVPQVKFVDRTFNCSHEHAMTIWKYLIDHDKGITNFHFEISADLLNEEEIRLIRSMRPGLIQLEIGVQSTNPQTIKEIHRTMKFEEVARIVKEIKKNGNVHQHLDLIAGLPYEDITSFAKSFDDVYALRPEQLQLGFLKVLKGSHMEKMQKEYGLVYKDVPPYEVLYTKWLSYKDVLRLKGIEDMVEVYYNSSQFTLTLEKLDVEYKSAFTLYDELASYYEEKGYDKVSHSRVSRYAILLAFIETKFPDRVEEFKEYLTYDYYLRENAKNRPQFAGEYRMDKNVVREFYETESKERNYLTGYEKYDKNQMRKMTHLEYFPHLGKTILFDYQHRSLLTREAKTIEIKLLQK